MKEFSIKEIEIGVLYIVTSASKNGALVNGDHIKLQGDGTLWCREAGGWLPKESVYRLRSLRLKIDLDSLNKREKKLREELQEIEKIRKR